MATSSGSANAHRRFEAIYDEHVTAIHRFVYARVGNRPDAEDLTGQVFMRAVEQLDIDRPAPQISAWLYRVAQNAVADYWREHYDLLEYLKRNWSTVGPKLVGKVHVYTGTADNFFLNNSTKELEEWMKTTQNPHYEVFFLYGDGKGHCWQGPETTAERLKQMAAHIAGQKPDGMTTPWWRY